MSIRTVIELNHDYIERLTWEDFQTIIRGLAGCEFSFADGKIPEPVTGIRILGQRHHSETLKMNVGDTLEKLWESTGVNSHGDRLTRDQLHERR